jgi:sugar O-acyltransferase (sialic acid O-acetyltransferase NeuD family)
MRDLVIVGGGGLAREVSWLIKEINSEGKTWNFLGYIEADPSRVGQPCGDAVIIGTDEWLSGLGRKISVVIGIGTPRIIDRIRQNLILNGNLQFPNLVHPNVSWDRRRIQLGVGNIVCAGNILTTDIRIGSFNVLNLASTYGHDAVIGDACVINPGVNLSGAVTVGDRCLLGTGSLVLENLVLGDDVTVGAGAVVTRNVDSGLTVVGIPARPLAR